MEKVKVAVVGLGWVAQVFHIPSCGSSRRRSLWLCATRIAGRLALWQRSSMLSAFTTTPGRCSRKRWWTPLLLRPRRMHIVT